MTSNGYKEYIESFTFYQSGAITIPKAVREKAFELSIDLEIASWLPDIGYNYKCEPAFSSYWNSTLVFMDFMAPPIQNQFGRQRLFFERNHSAIDAWEDFCTYRRLCTHMRNQWVLTQAVIGVPEEERLPFDDHFKVWNGFNEIQLREVYCLFPFGTVFRIEITWLEADNFIDMDGSTIQAKSRREDGKKDQGLPPPGAQPQQGHKGGNPYLGAAPKSSATELGDWGNFKGSAFDNSGNPEGNSRVNAPNANNAPNAWQPNVLATPTTEGWYMEIDWDYTDFNPCRTTHHRYYRAVPLNSFLWSGLHSTATSGCPDIHDKEIAVKILNSDTNAVRYDMSYAFTTGIPSGVMRWGVLPPE